MYCNGEAEIVLQYEELYCKRLGCKTVENYIAIQFIVLQVGRLVGLRQSVSRYKICIVIEVVRLAGLVSRYN